MPAKKFTSIKSKFLDKDILSIDQFDRSSIKKVFHLASRLEKSAVSNKFPQLLKNKLIALLFYEPSSRTFSSFATAVKKLGGQTIDYQNPAQTSSAVKGETIEDTVRVFENYVDLIVMRHPQIGTPQKASEAATIPIINAGDGAGEHPTQALLDLYTIWAKYKKLSNLKILIVGDLLYGRTVHSLLRGLAYFPDNEIFLLSPRSLKLPVELTKKLKKAGLRIHEIFNEKNIPLNCDVWYWTRVQKERFNDLVLYEKTKHSFILTKKLLELKGNKKLIIMHPLPRVGEIETAVDTDRRALYLTKEIKSGIYVRMALLLLVLGKKK